MAEVTYPISQFQLTQGFGENPASYARFNLDGHNGWDFKTKWPDTPDGIRPIIASWDSRFYTRGNEGSDGYGIYVEVLVQLEDLWKLTYAHCKEVPIFNTLKEGQSLAVSDNTGNSTGAHLHLTTKKGQLVNGVFKSFNLDNGYRGAVNPVEFFAQLQRAKDNVIIPNMDPDKTRAIANLDSYRKERKSGPEGNYEGFVAAVIESDRLFPALTLDKQNANQEINRLKLAVDDAVLKFSGEVETNQKLLKKIEGLNATIEDQAEAIAELQKSSDGEPQFKHWLARLCFTLAKFIDPR